MDKPELPSKPEVKRGKRTRKAIIEALLELLEENEFQQITINDICEKAEVTRPTLYAYYDDKYDLLKECLEWQEEDIRKMAVAAGGSDRDIITATVDNVDRNRHIYTNLLFGEVNREISTLFETALYHLNLESLRRHYTQYDYDPIPAEVIALFRANGTVTILNWWIRHAGDSVSRQELIEYLLELNMSEDSIYGDWPYPLKDPPS